MVTAVATSLMRFSDSEFFNRFPDIYSFTRILEYLGLRVVLDGSQILVLVSERHGEKPEQRIPNLSQDLVSILCPAAYLIMRGFQLSSDKGTATLRPPERNDLAGYFNLHPFAEILREAVSIIDESDC